MIDLHRTSITEPAGPGELVSGVSVHDSPGPIIAARFESPSWGQVDCCQSEYKLFGGVNRIYDKLLIDPPSIGTYSKPSIEVRRHRSQRYV